jgi:rRNA maturation protein Nop10
MDSVYTLVEKLFHCGSDLFIKNCEERYLRIIFSETFGRAQSFREEKLEISYTISVFQDNPKTNTQLLQRKISEPAKKKYGEFRNKNKKKKTCKSISFIQTIKQSIVF